MSESDSLRDELTKRGVKWEADGPRTWFYASGVEWLADETGSGLMLTAARLDDGVQRLTATQAIAATLGRGECKVDVLNTGDCAGYECSEYIMHCNACGHEFGHVLYNEDGDVWMSERPNFCPNCGCEVARNEQ